MGLDVYKISSPGFDLGSSQKDFTVLLALLAAFCLLCFPITFFRGKGFATKPQPPCVKKFDTFYLRSTIYRNNIRHQKNESTSTTNRQQ